MDIEIEARYDKYLKEYKQVKEEADNLIFRISDKEFFKRNSDKRSNKWSPSTTSLKNNSLEEQSINIITKYIYFREIYNYKGEREYKDSLFQSKSSLTTYDMFGHNIEYSRDLIHEAEYSEIFFIKELLLTYSGTLDKIIFVHELFEEDVYILEKRLLQLKAKKLVTFGKEIFDSSIGKGTDSIMKKSVKSLSRFFS